MSLINRCLSSISQSARDTHNRCKHADRAMQQSATSCCVIYLFESTIGGPASTHPPTRTCRSLSLPALPYLSHHASLHCCRCTHSKHHLQLQRQQNTSRLSHSIKNLRRPPDQSLINIFSTRYNILTAWEGHAAKPNIQLNYLTLGLHYTYCLG